MSASSSTPKKATPPPPLPLVPNLFAAGVTGCIAWLFAHPFEVIKNHQVLQERQQPPPGGAAAGSAPPAVKPAGLVATARRIMAHSGPAGLFAGVQTGLVRQVVYGSVRVGCFDPIKSVIVGERKATVVDRVVAGAAAGMLGAFCSSPVEVALVRITKAATTGATPPSLATAMIDIRKMGGIGAFWQGCTPLLTRAACVGVAQVAFFDQCLTVLNGSSYATANLGPSSINLLASVITGIFYSFVTMPIEVARVKMSADTQTPRRYTSMPQTILRVSRENGFLSMYRSYAPYLGRCGSHTIVMFVLMDRVRIWYHQH